MTQAPCFHLHCGDAVEWLRTLPDASIDMLNFDYAYESLEKHRKIGTTTRLKVSKASSNEWFPIFPNARVEELIVECYRVLKKNTHFYFYCDQETMFFVKPIAEQVGFKFWKPLVWRKSQIGMGYHYRAKYEFVLFFEKGKRKLRDLGVADVLDAPIVRNAYPTQKPYELNSIFTTQSTEPGETIVDPFMGSASSGVGAMMNGRSFLGNDITPKTIDIARNRLLTYGKESTTNWLNNLTTATPMDLSDIPAGPLLTGGPVRPVVTKEALAAARVLFPIADEDYLYDVACGIDDMVERDFLV